MVAEMEQQQRQLELEPEREQEQDTPCSKSPGIALEFLHNPGELAQVN